MKILSMDLGKFKSTACIYRSDDGDHQFRRVSTHPREIHDLIVEYDPERIVIEIGSQAGWVCDLARAFEIEIQVANPNHQGWRWKSVKRKTDRDDALKLAQLSAMNQLPVVHVPSPWVRQWRNLIAFRHSLVRRRTQIKNSIRALLDRQGLRMPSGQAGWTKKALVMLATLARPLNEVDGSNLWPGQLSVELKALEQIAVHIDEVEAKLEALARADGRVGQLR